MNKSLYPLTTSHSFVFDAVTLQTFVDWMEEFNSANEFLRKNCEYHLEESLCEFNTI